MAYEVASENGEISELVNEGRAIQKNFSKNFSHKNADKLS